MPSSPEHHLRHQSRVERINGYVTFTCATVRADMAKNALTIIRKEDSELLVATDHLVVATDHLALQVPNGQMDVLTRRKLETAAFQTASMTTAQRQLPRPKRSLKNCHYGRVSSVLGAQILDVFIFILPLGRRHRRPICRTSPIAFLN